MRQDRPRSFSFGAPVEGEWHLFRRDDGAADVHEQWRGRGHVRRHRGGGDAVPECEAEGAARDFADDPVVDEHRLAGAGAGTAGGAGAAAPPNSPWTSFPVHPRPQLYGSVPSSMSWP